jgi:hypothetical protein
MKIKIIIQILNVFYGSVKNHVDKETVLVLDKLFEKLNSQES